MKFYCKQCDKVYDKVHDSQIKKDAASGKKFILDGLKHIAFEVEEKVKEAKITLSDKEKGSKAKNLAKENKEADKKAKASKAEKFAKAQSKATKKAKEQKNTTEAMIKKLQKDKEELKNKKEQTKKIEPDKKSKGLDKELTKNTRKVANKQASLSKKVDDVKNEK